MDFHLWAALLQQVQQVLGFPQANISNCRWRKTSLWFTWSEHLVGFVRGRYKMWTQLIPFHVHLRTRHWSFLIFRRMLVHLIYNRHKYIKDQSVKNSEAFPHRDDATRCASLCGFQMFRWTDVEAFCVLFVVQALTSLLNLIWLFLFLFCPSVNMRNPFLSAWT